MPAWPSTVWSYSLPTGVQPYLDLLFLPRFLGVPPAAKSQRLPPKKPLFPSSLAFMQNASASCFSFSHSSLVLVGLLLSFSGVSEASSGISGTMLGASGIVAGRPALEPSLRLPLLNRSCIALTEFSAALLKGFSSKRDIPNNSGCIFITSHHSFNSIGTSGIGIFGRSGGGGGGGMGRPRSPKSAALNLPRGAGIGDGAQDNVDQAPFDVVCPAFRGGTIH